MNQPIYVTQPNLPPLSDFMPYLEEIWENKWLTNNGPMHKRLEDELAKYLGVKHLSLFCNGMSALQASLNCLQIKGEVITTPYTFVATPHSIMLQGCTPVFCDIDPDTLNIDINKIEELITERTTAILPVHVYGKPCNTKEIELLAKKYKLKVIYDAAHAFGVRRHGETILNHGDLSILSFHATKVFNTIEGGAVISPSIEIKTRIDQLKNFGIQNEESTISVAANGKMNELQAAFGLLQLQQIDIQISKRKEIADIYKSHLRSINGITIYEDIDNVHHNYGYFPILISPPYQLNRDELYNKLKASCIHSRKYFFPLVTEFPDYKPIALRQKAQLGIAESISSRILCLPIYPHLQHEEVLRIINLIKEV